MNETISTESATLIALSVTGFIALLSLILAIKRGIPALKNEWIPRERRSGLPKALLLLGLFAAMQLAVLIIHKTPTPYDTLFWSINITYWPLLVNGIVLHAQHSRRIQQLRTK